MLQVAMKLVASHCADTLASYPTRFLLFHQTPLSLTLYLPPSPIRYPSFTLAANSKYIYDFLAVCLTVFEMSSIFGWHTDKHLLKNV